MSALARCKRATLDAPSLLSAADVKRGIMDVGVDGMPLIIGIDGENIKRLQATSGRQIAAEPGTTLMLIRGTEEAINRARTMMVAQLTAADLLETVECSADAISAVIGVDSTTIRSIQESSGARMQCVHTAPTGIMLLGDEQTRRKARRLRAPRIVCKRLRIAIDRQQTRGDEQTGGSDRGQTA
jgi:polyribonucleotide nucleotidyltransferase